MSIYLTERELQVLNLLASGYTNKEVSEKLNISVHTTKAHLESIYEKFNIDNRLQAAVMGIKLGLIDTNDILVSVNE